MAMDGIGVAGSILTRAVTLDNTGRYTESLEVYTNGLEILVESLKAIPEEAKKDKIRAKIKEYMERAEKVKKHIEVLKQTGKYREQIQIEENSIGFSYVSTVSRFLNHNVHTVEIDDPYIRSPHQCDNLVRFIELCLTKCTKLKRINLCTGKDNNFTEQQKRLETLSSSLQQFQNRNISLTVDYSESLHDREIRLDNGWVIKIGRGLDYFKPCERFHVGWANYDLRPCRATTVDIFYKKELDKCH